MLTETGFCCANGAFGRDVIFLGLFREVNMIGRDVCSRFIDQTGLSGAQEARFLPIF